jgi:hypothetical protein
MTRETVAADTPAIAATSRMVVGTLHLTFLAQTRGMRG